MTASISSISDHPRFKRVREASMSKAQLALALGFSRRWIELRMKDGLPYFRRPNGTARFVLSDVEAWLAEWLDRRG